MLRYWPCSCFESRAQGMRTQQGNILETHSIRKGFLNWDLESKGKGKGMPALPAVPSFPHTTSLFALEKRSGTLRPWELPNINSPLIMFPDRTPPKRGIVGLRSQASLLLSPNSLWRTWQTPKTLLSSGGLSPSCLKGGSTSGRNKIKGAITKFLKGLEK